MISAATAGTRRRERERESEERKKSATSVGGDAKKNNARGINLGIVTATATNPIWVVKTRLQLQGRSLQRYANSLDCTLHILREEGIKGLYKGMSASYLGMCYL